MILSHKFEYGYNPDGGRRWASSNTERTRTVEKQQIKEILKEIPQNYTKCVENKAHDNK